MSPLERAARALCELDNNPPGATMAGKPLWMDYLPEVRAVVEAIREPSMAMRVAGRDGCAEMHVFENTDPQGPWTAMIDALLAEGK